MLEQSIHDILIKQEENLFSSEEDFQLELSIELKRRLKNNYPLNKTYIIIECYDISIYINNMNHIPKEKNIIKGSNRIDIVLIIDDSYYFIEIKYSAYDDLAKDYDYRAGIKNKDEIIPKFKDDIKKLHNIINYTNSNNLKGSFCILLVTSNLLNECNIKVIDEDLNWNENELFESNYSYCIKCL